MNALNAFKRWEGEELGEEVMREKAGFDGFRIAPRNLLHIAGAWAMSTGRRDRDGALHPAVYVRLCAGVVGTGPLYHVLDGIIDADVAQELGETMLAAAEAARRDVTA